ncbi:MAG: hypothetical protein ACJAYN_003293 [Bermanella sp.]
MDKIQISEEHSKACYEIIERFTVKKNNEHGVSDVLKLSEVQEKKLLSISNRAKIKNPSKFIEQSINAITHEFVLIDLHNSEVESYRNKHKAKQIKNTTMKLLSLIVDADAPKINQTNSLFLIEHDNFDCSKNNLEWITKSLISYSCALESYLTLLDLKKSNQRLHAPSALIQELATIFKSYGCVVSANRTTIFFDYVTLCLALTNQPKEDSKKSIEKALND